MHMPPARAGLAFGAWLGETQHVTDDMLMAASETLPDLIRPTDMSLGRVFPCLADIRRGLIIVCICLLKSPAPAASGSQVSIPTSLVMCLTCHTFRSFAIGLPHKHLCYTCLLSFRRLVIICTARYRIAYLHKAD